MSLTTASGRAGMSSALRAAARAIGADAQAIPWAQLDAARVRVILGALTGAPSTKRKILAALKGVARASHELGLMPADKLAGILGIRGARGGRLPPGRHVDAGEVRALVEACAADLTPAGARDTAIVALLRATGIRRAEVVGLMLADYDAQHGTLRVLGKGDKERRVYVQNGAARAMADWLTIRGGDPGPLFPRILKGGRVTARAMTPTALHLILAKRVEAAGIEDMTAHDLRRTFVSDLLDAGADVVIVAKLAGHASVTTTQRYDRRGDRAAERAAQFIAVPYRGRQG